jgi:AcrR family transcriptional regulator
MATPTDRPLRRDAQRNIERIRAAAIRVFREHGLDASHEVIAHEADVSVGTVYRRFPDREQLIDSLFEEEIDGVVAIAREALAIEDPWAGLVHMFERGIALSAENLGLKQLITGSRRGAERVAKARDRLQPLVTEIIERARAAGAVRPDADPADMPMTLLMMGTLIDAGRGHDPEPWRRYLWLILDGLRPEGQPRQTLPRAPEPDSVDRIITAHHRV